MKTFAQNKTKTKTESVTKNQNPQIVFRLSSYISSPVSEKTIMIRGGVVTFYDKNRDYPRTYVKIVDCSALRTNECNRR